MAIFMDIYFCKFQCSFKKVWSTQKCLIALVEKWKSAVDSRKSFGVLIKELSKAFDCLLNKLLLAKLNSYGFSLSAIRLIRSYFCNRQQRTKINESYSSRDEILFGVSQESIFRYFLFNIFMFDLLTISE